MNGQNLLFSYAPFKDDKMKDFTKYIELAKICKLTYASPINHKLLTIENVHIKHQKIIYGSAGRGFCRVFWNESYLIIAFRGTREKIDWAISNFKLWPAKFKISQDVKLNFRVHHGFQETLNYIDKTTKLTAFESIICLIEEKELLNNRKLFVTRHSLGGALAKLFITRLLEVYKNKLLKKNIEVIVYGAPAVGFSRFKKHYNQNLVKTVRIVNGSDIVPFTPPIFYKHVGEELWFKKDKLVHNLNWFSRLMYSLKLPLSKFSNDHSISEYIENLEEAAKN